MIKSLGFNEEVICLISTVRHFCHEIIGEVVPAQLMMLWWTNARKDFAAESGGKTAFESYGGRSAGVEAAITKGQ